MKAQKSKTTSFSLQIQKKQAPKSFFNRDGERAFFNETTPDIQPKPFFTFDNHSDNTPFFGRSNAQPKPASPSGRLTVGQPNDKLVRSTSWHEQEAHAMADPVVQRLEQSNSPSDIQQKCNQCAEEENIQKKEETEEQIDQKELKESENDIQTKKIVESNEENIQCKTERDGSLNGIISIPNRMHLTESVVQQKTDQNEDENIVLENNDVRAKLSNELTIGRPDDKYEQEADAIADQVVQKLAEPGPVTQEDEEIVPNAEKDIQEKPIFESDHSEENIQTKPEAPDVTKIEHSNTTSEILNLSKLPVITPIVQKKCEQCEEETEEEGESDVIQRKALAHEDGPIHREFTTWDDEQKKNKHLFPKLESWIQMSGSGGSRDPEATRKKIVELAQAEIGKVKSKVNDGGKRFGSDRLLEYFHLAAKGVWPDDVIEDPNKKMPEWCGIFAVWAIKKAGIDVGNWVIGRGVMDHSTLKEVSEPKQGDIGYIQRPFNHQCIIDKIEGDTIVSIDGNQTAGAISERRRPRTTFTAFFSPFTGSEKYIQKKEETDHNTSTESLSGQLSRQSGKGAPMDTNTRDQMESSFGTDFSDVNIHTDSSAIEMNKGLHAQAFTHGSDIYFNEGKYKPESISGKHLLAHELTHTVQQNSNSIAPRLMRRPTEEDLNEGRMSYSERCGWIDWSHTIPGGANAMISAVRNASRQLEANGDGEPVELTLPTMRSGFSIFTSSAVSGRASIVRPLSEDEILSVALRLFMMQSTRFESVQVWTDFFAHSSFSEEDLPSNIISFYRAARGFDIPMVRNFCGAMNIEDSLSAFENYRFQQNRSFLPRGVSRDTWPSAFRTIQPAQFPGPLLDHVVLEYGTFMGLGGRGTVNLLDLSSCGPLYQVIGNIEGTGEASASDQVVVMMTGNQWTAFDGRKRIQVQAISASAIGLFTGIPLRYVWEDTLRCYPNFIEHDLEHSEESEQDTRQSDSTEEKLFFYHGSLWKHVQKICREGIRAIGGGDFAAGFYTFHVRGAPEAAYRRSKELATRTTIGEGEQWAGIVELRIPLADYENIRLHGNYRNFELTERDQSDFQERQRTWLDFVTTYGRYNRLIYMPDTGAWGYKRITPHVDIDYDLIVGPMYGDLPGLPGEPPNRDEFIPWSEGNDLIQQYVWANEGVSLLNQDRVEKEFEKYDAREEDITTSFVSNITCADVLNDESGAGSSSGHGGGSVPFFESVDDFPVGVPPVVFDLRVLNGLTANAEVGDISNVTLYVGSGYNFVTVVNLIVIENSGRQIRLRVRRA